MIVTDAPVSNTTSADTPEGPVGLEVDVLGGVEIDGFAVARLVIGGVGLAEEELVITESEVAAEL